jgi:hypothetical protein
MFKKLWGSVLALIPVAIGVAILMGQLTPDTIDSDSGRSKLRFLKSILEWLMNNLGATASGAILIAIGVIALVVVWKPSGEAKSAKG